MKEGVLVAQPTPIMHEGDGAGKHTRSRRRTWLTGGAYPAEHGRPLRTTNPIASPVATVRRRQRMTEGAGSRTKGLLMAFRRTQALGVTGHLAERNGCAIPQQARAAAYKNRHPCARTRARRPLGLDEVSASCVPHAFEGGMSY